MTFQNQRKIKYFSGYLENLVFQNQKKGFLIKKDKSRKGSIDKKIRKLVDKINSLENYYTTSSCSGRILILIMPKSGKKQDTKWLFSSHYEVKLSEIKKILSKISTKEDIWFRAEPAIMHIAADTMENAVKLLNTARNIGFRRSGIIGVRKNKVSAELISTERLETIIAKKGKIIADEDYLRHLIAEANIKLEKTRKKINKFYSSIKSSKL